MFVDMNEYQKLAMRTNSDQPMTQAICNGVFGLCGEAGEVADLLKKSLFHGHELDKQSLSKELGDVMWYVACLAETFNLKLDKIAQQNIDKLIKRYPEGFDKQRSINRSE
jgi:NTP pyrophosphatase (non-canonical NTP hydrolase)